MGKENMPQKFSREWLTEVRKDIAAALEPVGKKYSVLFDTNSNISYTEGERFNIKLTAAVVPSGQEGLSPDETLWNAYAKDAGIDESLFGAEFTTSGGTYRVVGINPNSRVNMIRIQDCANGRLLVTSKHELYEVLGRGKEPKLFGSSVSPLEEQKRKWEQCAAILGIANIPMGTEFQYAGATYVANELNLRAAKYPVIASDKATGKPYKFSLSALKSIAE